MNSEMTTAPSQVRKPSRPIAAEVELRPEPPLWRSILKTARPKQWPKNVLVFAAPASAGQLTHRHVLLQSIFAAVSFTIASVGTYFINDVLDHKADRLHPKKRWRPIAAGWIGLHAATITGALFLAIAIIGSAVVLNVKFTGLMVAYVVMTLSYSLWLKRVPVFDIACVAAGFILRMIAGGVGTDIFISEWFIIVGCFSSLFVVTGKRYAEVRDMGEGNNDSRAVLSDYNANFLRTAWTMSMTVAIASYVQWAFLRADATHSPVWYQLSVVPWVLALLRYALRLETGHGGAPEEVLMSDRVLQALGLVWLLFFGIGVYAG